ncbi:hypothetical protein SASPL_141239 [Salvia splendens]|uniref:Uncharacterized protein n=1 Tax=Salvia splendens TaxID=180675 RepID=A0A8X8WSM1_SALSN|nr:hypothetical protein SASPL_141239 [Salvia splendens]
MGRKQNQDDLQKQQSKSLRTKAAHFVSDLTTGLLNPISDKPSTPPPQPSSSVNFLSQFLYLDRILDDLDTSENKQSETEGLKDSADGPDTSSFTAFLYSFIAPSESRAQDEKSSSPEDDFAPPSEPMTTKENAKKKSLFSRGKQSLGKAFYQAARIGGFRSQSMKGNPDLAVGDGGDSKGSRDDGIALKILNESQPSVDLNLPEISEPSLLLSENTRSLLYGALPHLEAWNFTFNFIQKKYDLAWPQSAGSHFTYDGALLLLTLLFVFVVFMFLVLNTLWQ